VRLDQQATLLKLIIKVQGPKFFEVPHSRKSDFSTQILYLKVK